MAANVFLAPCDSGNFDRTVLTEVALDDHPDHPPALNGAETVRFWGARVGSGNETYFEKMEPGDVVLFYQAGQYIGVGFIGHTFEDDAKWASETFWRGAPSKLIYTVEEFSQVAVPKEAVNRIFDYAEDYYPQGLTRVAPSRVEKSPRVVKLAVEKYHEKHRSN